MLKVLLLLLTMGVVLVVSCSPPAVPIVNNPNTPPDSVGITYSTVAIENGVEDIEEIEYPKDVGDVIIPSSIHIRNCVAGKTDEWETKVYNSSLDRVTYATTFRYPDINNLKADVPPFNIGDWITIDNPVIDIEPQSEGIFHYHIAIPEDARLSEVCEFWITIKKVNQPGFVQTECILRCYIYRVE